MWSYLNGLVHLSVSPLPLFCSFSNLCGNRIVSRSTVTIGFVWSRSMSWESESMARQLPQNHLANHIPGTTPSLCVQEEHLLSARKWYFCKQEIENHSPSRKDGIDFKKESQLRKSYCSFLQELGMKLKV